MKKVIFNLTDEQYERLGMLSKRMGITRSAALRQAIELYQFIREAQKEGAELRKHAKDGQETIIQVL